MNFIKKKIKGHKRGHESDDEVEAAIYAKQIAERQQEQQQQQALASAAGHGSDPFDPFADPSDPSAGSLRPAEDPEEKKRNSEEWRFFEQLTQRVQDTVQKTQDTLTKIKETSAITELNKPDYYLESETLSPEEPAAAAPLAVAKSPARSWVNFEDGRLSSEAPESAPATSVASKPPPRPPPPSKPVEQAAPQDEAIGQSVEGSQQLNGEGHNVELELLEEFGFAPRDESRSPAVVAPISLDSFVEGPLEEPTDDPFDTSIVDALLQPTLKTKEDTYETVEPETVEPEDDPFDTSFVDVASSRNSSTEKTGQKLFSPSADLSNRTSPASAAATGTSGALAEMSNPFLVDNAPSTPGESLFGGLNGTTTDSEPPAEVPNFFSGSRRSSTNPFDNMEEDLEFFRNTLVGSAGETEDASKGAELFEAIASTFPCEGQRDDTDQKADLFGFGTAEDAQVPKTTTDFDPFNEHTFQAGSNQDAGSAFTKAAENQLAEDPFQVAFGKTTVDHDFSPEKQAALAPAGGGLFGSDSVEMSDDQVVSSPPNVGSSFGTTTTSGGFFEKRDHSPPCTESPLAMETDAPAKTVPQHDLFGSLDRKAEEHSSFDPFSDISRSTLEPVPAAVASITPQREDFTPFGLGDAAPCEADVAPLRAFDAFQETASAANNSSNFDPFGNFEDNTSPMEAKTEPPVVTAQNASNAFGEFDLLRGEPHKESTPTKTHNYDPFDTTNIQLEPAKGAVPFTDTAAFEAFAAKFEQAIEKFEDTAAPVTVMTTSDAFDPFTSSQASVLRVEDHGSNSDQGFGGMDIFDPFAVATKPPENTPVRTPVPKKMPSQDSFDDDDVGTDFSVVIRPKMREGNDIPEATLGPPPKLLPPPKSPVRTPGGQTTASRFNPFDKTSTQKDDLLMLGDEVEDEGGPSPAVSIPTSSVTEEAVPALGEAGVKRAEESAESPSTPLFDEDTSQPLEEFRFKFEGEGWEMMLRHPNKKKITGNRYWKKVFVRMTEQNILYLYNKKEDNDPFQEVPLQACYSLSEVGAQQFDAYGKIFTVKLQYIFYRERMGVRPGQISKVMQGQITSMGQFAKLGLPLEHAPQVSQLLKLGTQCSEDLKTFVQVVEDALFRLQIHRDRALTYKTEEIQVTVQDEFIVEQDKTGHVYKQKARVRIFFLAFITGMPDIEVGVNDLTREGKEVVGRYDIMPVVTEEWIRLENCEFHSCVMQEEFENNRVIKLHPPDACLFELMRFRIRPPRARELPLQLKVVMQVSPRHVELRGDVLVPGYHSRKHGQVACEDIQIRFPIPECWVYLFRVEKHFRYGALKSAARKPGKIKGMERIIGAAQPLDTSLIEVSTGQAKYEHAYRAVVWRIPRLPKEGQGAYTTHLFLLRLDLTSFDQIPESFAQYVDVEFTMPATSVSHTTVRSISVSNENPPEKYVRYLSKHEYRVELELQTGEMPPSQTEISNLAATAAAQSASFESTQPATAAVTTAAANDSDSD
ncbi:unnamed protein product [Ixodes hexagonus]